MRYIVRVSCGVKAMKMKEFLRDSFQPIRTELPRESSDPRGPRDWTDVGILQLANFFLKCWIANLAIALVFGIIGGVIWLFLLGGLSH
jgi:hypothetical protein